MMPMMMMDLTVTSLKVMIAMVNALLKEAQCSPW